MPFKKDKVPSYKTLTPSNRGRESGAAGKVTHGTSSDGQSRWVDSRSLITEGAEAGLASPDGIREVSYADAAERENKDTSFSPNQSERKAQLQEERDNRRLASDALSFRKGHGLTYFCLFLFTLTVYFRPYELIPVLSDFTSMALLLAIFTLIVYLPGQFSTEGVLTVLTTETKCILFMAFWALITIPI